MSEELHENYRKYKEWKKEKNRLRRKHRRAAAAQLRSSQEDKANDAHEQMETEELESNSKLHELWLQREREAQAAWNAKQSFLRRQEKLREEEQKRIREEWEVQQEKDRLEMEKREQEKREQEEKLKEIHASQKTSCEKSETQNPQPPTNQTLDSQSMDVCHFFRKVGACRFGDRCSRVHIKPMVSCTILISNMYNHPSLDNHYEYDTDVSLEYDDQEFYQHFKDFYADVLREFDQIGRVLQFKVCCNYEPHLRGNVYVQYSGVNEAHAAFKAFNGRWYGGRQLQCSFTSVNRWKPAVCGLYHRNRCPKGRTCNFLHVFKNPDERFYLADRDCLPHAGVSSSERCVHRSGRSSHNGWSSDDEDITTPRESTSTRARDRREWSSESSRYRGSRHHEERRRSSSSGSKHKKSRKRSRSRDKSDSKRDKRSRERDESYAHKDDTRQKLRHREHSRSRRNSLSGVRSRSRERFKKRSGRHDELALNGRGQEWSVENGGDSHKMPETLIESRPNKEIENLESVKSRLVESTYTESVKENDNDRNVLEPGTLGSVELDDELAVDWRFCRTPSDYGGASPDHLTVLQDSSSSSTH